MASWTQDQGKATKNKNAVGVTFVRDPLLGAEPCEGLLLFPGVGSQLAATFRQLR